MGRGFKKFQSILLIGALLVGIPAPMGHVQAESSIEIKVANQCDLKPFTVTETVAENFAEFQEEIVTSAVEVSDADRAYWTKFGSDYYYNSLTEEEKILWDGLEEACLKAVVGTEDVTKVGCYDRRLSYYEEELGGLKKVLMTFLYSKPQYYFLQNDWTFSGYYDENHDAVFCGIYFKVHEEFQNGEARKATTEQFTARIDSWVAQIEQGNRPEEKVKLAHDIICANTIYKSNDYDQTAYSMVCLGETVCAGYTKTTELLLNAVGVETVILTSAYHAWNAVNLHGIWYQLDTTLADTDDGEPIYRYYNKSYQTFQKYGAHTATYDFYLTNSPYDMTEDTNDYVSPYFTVGGNTYFVVNVNTALGDRMAMLIEGNNTAPSSVSYNGKAYKVILDNTGTTPDDIASVPEEVRGQVEAFVERMYTVALGRAAEESGLKFWTNMLLTHKNDGAGLAQGFILSPEFKNKNYTDEEYIKVLYKTFFNREAEADPSGFTYWMGILSAGNTRESVLAGFVNSTEFDSLCRSYGISRGIMREDGTVINPGIWQFSERLYTTVLERGSEKDGIEYWTRLIADGVCTPEDAAKEFFWSPEYLNKQTGDEKYVETLYRTFFDRVADADGLSYWLSVLDNGSDREHVLEGFAQSDEFKEIMARYGL